MTQQLALGVQLRDDTTFDDYYFGCNEQISVALESVLALPDASFIYLWGALGVGRSHLLQACCHRAAQLNMTSVYLPLQNFSQLSQEMFIGLEQIDVVCLDDIDRLAGNAVWEESFFDCYNRVRDSGRRLIVTASVAPKALGMHLPDLVSRLSWGLTFHLKSLSDEEKIEALILRAAKRGFLLSKEVAAFVLTHYTRDNKALFEILDKLDYESLAAQRRLTIPFVKSILI